MQTHWHLPVSWRKASVPRFLGRMFCGGCTICYPGLCEVVTVVMWLGSPLLPSLAVLVFVIFWREKIIPLRVLSVLPSASPCCCRSMLGNCFLSFLTCPQSELWPWVNSRGPDSVCLIYWNLMQVQTPAAAHLLGKLHLWDRHSCLPGSAPHRNECARSELCLLATSMAVCMDVRRTNRVLLNTSASTQPGTGCYCRSPLQGSVSTRLFSTASRERLQDKHILDVCKIHFSTKLLEGRSEGRKGNLGQLGSFNMYQPLEPNTGSSLPLYLLS